MMANYVQKGNSLDFTNTGENAIEYHDVVPLNSRIGVAQQEIAPGDTGSVAVVGVWEVPADTTVAFTAGQSLFWDTKNNKAVKDTGEGIVPAGYAFADKATAGATVFVKIGW